jgi:YaiO family outer membrane protein
MRSALFCFWLILMGQALSAQDWKSLDADDLFRLARQTAFDGKRVESRDMLKTILEANPDYHEVRTFLARTYGWDAEFDNALAEIKRVIEKDPHNQDALDLLVDLKIWSKRFDEALVDVDRALLVYPASISLLFKKALTLKELNRPQESARQIARLLELDPAHSGALALRNELQTSVLKYFVGLTAGVDLFSEDFDNAFYGSVQAGSRGQWGTGMIRFNYANRFSEQGWQPELELYPRLTSKMYAYVNYGYSNSVLFPRHRVGAEVYSSRPKNFETSLGMRYLYFNDSSTTTILTASIGYYVKAWWLNWRPYYSFSEIGNSLSNNFAVRRYFENADNYVGVLAGFGFAPDERRLQSGGGFTDVSINLLKAQRFGAVWQKALPADIILNLSLNFTRQEQSYESGNYFWISSPALWIRKMF